MLATEALDLLTLAFLAIGIEKFGVTHIDISEGLVMVSPASIAWSHSLIMALVWSSLAAAIAFLAFRDRRAGSIVGLLVFSHWVLDFIVHPQELPLLFGGSQMLGLCLWCSGPGLVIAGVLEFALLAGGLAIYVVHRKTQARRTGGSQAIKAA
jgi:membrane-bound metal-dependent hydrolase YbcI (DUF457 family)